MNNTTVPEEATGMRNLDPDKTSPMIGAVAQMLAAQPITATEADDLIAVVRRSAGHATWCRGDVYDEREGYVCSSSTLDYEGQSEGGSVSVEGSAARCKIAVEVGRTEAHPESSTMLFISPEEGRSLSRMLRGAPSALADVLDDLLEQVEAGREAVR